MKDMEAGLKENAAEQVRRIILDIIAVVAPDADLSNVETSKAVLKIKTPSRTVLRPRRRLNVWCAVDCACGGPGAVFTPDRLSDVDLTPSD